MSNNSIEDAGSSSPIRPSSPSVPNNDQVNRGVADAAIRVNASAAGRFPQNSSTEEPATLRTPSLPTLSEEDQETVVLAAQNDNLHLVKTYLSRGRISEEKLGKAIRIAAKNGHVEIVRFLLSERRTISEYILGAAVIAAVKNGHVEIVRFFLSERRTSSEYILCVVVDYAAANGHLKILEFLLSEGRTISQGTLDEAVRAAAKNGHVEIVRFLLSERRTISEYILDEAVWAAAKNGHVEIVRFLLSEERTISQDTLGLAVIKATEKGHLEVVRFLLSEERTISQDTLGLAVIKATEKGHLEVVRFLLSEERTISRNKLGDVVLLAAANGHLEGVCFLLSEGRSISQNKLGSAVMQAASRGHFTTVEYLLQHGPIEASARDSAITQAIGEQREAIQDILRMARTVSIDDTTSQPRDPNAIYLTFDDLKQNPMQYLQSVCDMGNFSRVYLIDSPQTIDLGGVTKQFITVLMESLLEKDALRVSNTGFPTIEEDKDRDVLAHLGYFYSIIMQKNTDRNDPFLTGAVFSPGFFKLVQEVAKVQPQDQLNKSAAQLLQIVDPDLDLCTKLILDPSEENKAAYADMMGCSPDEALADAKAFLDKYTQASTAFFISTGELLRDKITSTDPAALCLKIQGAEVSAEALLKALKVDVESKSNIYFNQQVEWIREAIENADLQWLQKFVKIITGNSTLAPHSKLLIRKGWREVFEFHTCFNSLDLPPQEMSKENFLNALNACLSDTGYNIG